MRKLKKELSSEQCEAYSGLLIAAFRKKTGDATFLVFLMDWIG
ncbi:MAG: hypothetical protein ACFE9R_09105 [Candidatus Hermodarchaeota archaeon]